MFKNREEAGKLLSSKLSGYQKDNDAIVLAIPRGGVIVGKQIANLLKIQFAVIIVKKLTAPHNPELAIGAITLGKIKIIDWDLALRLGVEQEYLDMEIEKKSKEVEERERKFSRPAGGLESRIKNKKIIILTDDGVATGATVLAAIKYIKESDQTVGYISTVMINHKLPKSNQLIWQIKVLT